MIPIRDRNPSGSVPYVCYSLIGVNVLVFLVEFSLPEKERYDLVIPHVHYTSDRLAPLLELLQDERFRHAVASLPGYDVAPMGKEIASIG